MIRINDQILGVEGLKVLPAVQVTLPDRDFLPKLMFPGFAWQVVKTIDI